MYTDANCNIILYDKTNYRLKTNCSFFVSAKPDLLIFVHIFFVILEEYMP